MLLSVLGPVLQSATTLARLDDGVDATIDAVSDQLDSWLATSFPPYQVAVESANSVAQLAGENLSVIRHRAFRWLVRELGLYPIFEQLVSTWRSLPADVRVVTTQLARSSGNISSFLEDPSFGRFTVALVSIDDVLNSSTVISRVASSIGVSNGPGWLMAMADESLDQVGPLLDELGLRLLHAALQDVLDTGKPLADVWREATSGISNPAIIEDAPSLTSISGVASGDVTGTAKSLVDASTGGAYTAIEKLSEGDVVGAAESVVTSPVKGLKSAWNAVF